MHDPLPALQFGGGAPDSSAGSRHYTHAAMLKSGIRNCSKLSQVINITEPRASKYLRIPVPSKGGLHPLPGPAACVRVLLRPLRRPGVHNSLMTAQLTYGLSRSPPGMQMGTRTLNSFMSHTDTHIISLQAYSTTPALLKVPERPLGSPAPGDPCGRYSGTLRLLLVRPKRPPGSRDF